MNGEYTIYRRNRTTGIREELIERYTSFSMTINWGELSSFSIEGATTGTVELEEGDGVVFYRNGQYLFSGIVGEVEISCKDVNAGLKEWTAEGKEDSVMFSRWLAFADPVNITFNDDINDLTTGYAWNRIIYYIRRNMGADALVDRKISGLTLPAAENTGQNIESSARYDQLDQLIFDIGNEVDSAGVPNGLQPRFVWNPETGAKSVTIEKQRDRTADITIGAEFCNLTSWTKTRTVPTCNAVWAVSGTYDDNGTDTRLWVSATDPDSITKYGRFEKVVTCSDVSVSDEMTQSEAYALLNVEARKALQEGAAQDKFSGTMVETPELRFMTDWICGDLVTCVIDGTSFVTTIKTVEVEFADGVETVKPTLGECEHGKFAEIFKELRGLDTRMAKEELN